MNVRARLVEQFAAEGMWEEASMSEYDVLYTLRKHGKPMRIREILGGVMLSQPALSRLLDRLERRGLITCATDPDDARAVLVQLTDEGLRIQRKTGKAHANSVTKALSCLDEQEKAELHRLCQKLLDANDKTK